MAAPSATEQIQHQSSNILLRNRENQRASRARRKGYIEDLEGRVRRFERDGAAATVEVQSAARKVAEENFWLRSLLGQSGIAKHEVDDYVERNRLLASSAGQLTQSAKLLLPVAQRKRKHSEMSARELEAARTLGQIDSPKHASTGQSWDSVRSPRATRDVFRDLPTPEDSNGSEQEHATSPELPALSEHHEQQRRHQYQNQPEALHLRFEGPDEARQTDVTPCEEAAHIIASMRGHEDPDSIYPELGCSPDQKCHVKNMTIFQIADDER